MGSKRVVALVEQRGNIITNPEEIVPDSSNPILQIDSLTIGNNSKPILQKTNLVTQESSPGNSISKPVLQQSELLFPRLGTSSPDDSFIQQVIAATEDSPSRPGDGESHPIEQFEITKSNERLQQFELKRNDSIDGTPIEQEGRITNNIGVEQFDFIELIFPPCGSIKNPTNTNILWRIRDFGFSFDVNSLIFIVNGTQVQNNSNFSVTDIGNGLEFLYDPPNDFDFSSIVELFVQIDDIATPFNRFFVRCSWTTVPDTLPPVIINVTPCDQKTGVSVVSPVTFDVVDFGLGVDQSSVVLNIEGLPICSGISFDPQIFPGSGIGFHIEWNHPTEPFKFESNVTISITAGDLAVIPNTTLFVCDFNTEQSIPPDFQDLNPLPCDTFIDNRTGLTFQVYGNLHGIDITTLEVRVDNRLRRVIVEPRILRSQ